MSTEYKSEQDQFWAETYAKEYMEKNKEFDEALGVEAWATMLKKAGGINSILECGCNIGRNLIFLNKSLPLAKKSIIEISKPAYYFVTQEFDLENKINSSILEADLDGLTFDLVFTIGVLIHIHPDDLLANMKKIFGLSHRYILMGEYFNRTPMMLEYQGQMDKLFKRDFGRVFIENFNVVLVDYGFLWGYVYDSAGFDDATWWLFEKTISCSSYSGPTLPVRSVPGMLFAA